MPVKAVGKTLVEKKDRESSWPFKNCYNDQENCSRKHCSFPGRKNSKELS